jgi:hypothetical protein
MTSFRKNFEMNIKMEVDTRMMMRTLLLPTKQRREKGNSRTLPVDSLPLKMARRKT